MNLFQNLITEAYPSKLVYTSEIANGSALGAALVISGSKPALNLGLTECKINCIKSFIYVKAAR